MMFERKDVRTVLRRAVRPVLRSSTTEYQWSTQPVIPKFTNNDINTIKYVGRYHILIDFIVPTQVKPSWLHRVFTRLILGWVWEDIKD